MALSRPQPELLMVTICCPCYPLPTALDTLYNNIADKLGYITNDNHEAKIFVCRCITEKLKNWDPMEYRPYCMGRRQPGSTGFYFGEEHGSCRGDCSLGTLSG